MYEMKKGLTSANSLHLARGHNMPANLVPIIGPNLESNDPGVFDAAFHHIAEVETLPVSTVRGGTIAAVVVTYNRKDLLAQCLDAVLAQTQRPQAVYVIDNASTDGTGQMVGELYSARVIYERLAENIGGAGGFRHGIKRAFDDHYDWIWVMDDDAQPTAECVEILLRHAVAGVGFVAPMILDRNRRPQAYHHKVLHRRADSIRTSWSAAKVPGQCGLEEKIPLDASAFVGPLINRIAIEAKGLPRAEYFILYDDHEYTYRISRGFPSYLVPCATILHFDVGNGRTARPYQTRWKTYYHTRNWVDFTRRVDGPLAALLLVVKIILATTVKVGCGWYRNPLYSYRTYCLGALHGLIGRFHNDWHLAS
jgi:rhamnopyranosyl-N-acetylglucosaminyl-diphospho-decaprenol beta-1,3/1,4-galactofuranosyltransferase